MAYSWSAALLAVMGFIATTDTGLAASITLTSSGGGEYDYALALNNENITFDLGQTITLSGLSDVTGASVGDTLAGAAIEVSSVTSTSVVFVQTFFLSGEFVGPGTFGTLVVDSSAPTTGAVDYTMLTTSGTISGTVAGPVAATVPEPATWVMALFGFAGLGFAARRRAKLKGSVGFSAA